MSDKINTIFFGTPHFAEIVLQKLINSPYKPSLVVTSPDKPVGRKQELLFSPVKTLAKKHSIKIWQPEKLEIENWKLEINKLGNIDLVIVAAYGKIIPKSILDTLPAKFINVHPSLLPKYRGPSPIAGTILSGDKKTGVTIMLMDKKMDHGPVLAVQELGITNSKLTTPELTKILAEQGADLLMETIPKYINGEIKPKEQEHDKATYTKLIKREDGRIDWKKSAQYIERQLRAFTPWPGIYTYFNNKRLKILSLEILNSVSDNTLKDTNSKPGTIVGQDGGFAIQTKKGLIVPKNVQFESKNPQTAEEFLRGHPEIIGSVLK